LFYGIAKIGAILAPLNWRLVASELTYIVNDVTMKFLKTGKFDFRVFGLANVQYKDDFAPKSFDFFGLNYYATAVIGFNMENGFGDTHFPGQIMGDMHLPIDPHGFKQALKEASSFGVPVYVTENGIADAKDNRRKLFLASYIKALSEALDEGLDIRGYYYWTLIDNFEWNQGRTKKFGLFDANRKMRKSASFYSELIASA